MTDRFSDSTIEAIIFSLLEKRAVAATICPSDAARALIDVESEWRALMPRIRAVAGRLVERGLLRVTRGGVDVEATSRGGPIRLGRPKKPD